MPNKFFEFLQARLMIAISPNPEMACLVKEYDLGVVNYSPEMMAQQLNQLSVEQINKFKQNTHSAAKKLNAQTQNEKIVKLIYQVIRDSELSKK